MSRTSDTPLARLRDRHRDKATVYTVLVLGALLWSFPLVTAVRESVARGGFVNYAFLVCSVGAMAAYAFTKLVFPGRDTLYHLALISLGVPATALIVPVHWIIGQGEGEFPPQAVERLDALAGWMERHGESVHGTRPGLKLWQFHGPSTVRGLQDGGSRLYLHPSMRPYERITVRGLPVARVREVTPLRSAGPWSARSRPS